MRNKNHKNNFPPLLPSSQAYHSQFSLCLPMQWHRGTQLGTAMTSSRISTVPSSSGEGLLTLLHCSSMGSLPWNSSPWASPVSVLPLGCNSAWAAPGHFPWDAVLQDHTGPSWVSCRVTGSASKPSPAQSPYSMGPQVLLETSSSTNPSWDQTHLWAWIWSRVRFSTNCSGSLILYGPPSSAGVQLLYHGLHNWLRWNIYSGSWGTSSPSCVSDLGVSRSIPFTYSHSYLWLLLLLPS